MAHSKKQVSIKNAHMLFFMEQETIPVQLVEDMAEIEATLTGRMFYSCFKEIKSRYEARGIKVDYDFNPYE